jgi:hypothetical protein
VLVNVSFSSVAIAVLECVGRALDPNLDVLWEAALYVARAKLEQAWRNAKGQGSA